MMDSLCIIDGAKGLRKALYDVFGSKALVQRCQWHKRENMLRYLPKGMQGAMRRKLRFNRKCEGGGNEHRVSVLPGSI
jgi:transposase-like protein